MSPWPQEANFDQYGSVGDELCSHSTVLVSTEGAAGLDVCCLPAGAWMDRVALAGPGKTWLKWIPGGVHLMGGFPAGLTGSWTDAWGCKSTDPKVCTALSV